MPYKLRKAPNRNLYWVVNKETGQKYSKDPLPRDKATGQMRALYAATSEGSGLTHRLSFLKQYKLEDKPYSLKELSDITKVPLTTLQEVYNRGIGAYKTQPKSVRLKHNFVKNVDAPPSYKLSKENWAQARVYSFLDGNPKHDNDLRLKGGGWLESCLDMYGCNWAPEIIKQNPYIADARDQFNNRSLKHVYDEYLRNTNRPEEIERWLAYLEKSSKKDGLWSSEGEAKTSYEDGVHKVRAVLALRQKPYEPVPESPIMTLKSSPAPSPSGSPKVAPEPPSGSPKVKKTASFREGTKSGEGLKRGGAPNPWGVTKALAGTVGLSGVANFLEGLDPDVARSAKRQEDTAYLNDYITQKNAALQAERDQTARDLAVGQRMAKRSPSGFIQTGTDPTTGRNYADLNEYQKSESQKAVEADYADKLGPQWRQKLDADPLLAGRIYGENMAQRLAEEKKREDEMFKDNVVYSDWRQQTGPVKANSSIATPVKIGGAKYVRIPMKDFVKEHSHLISLLKHPTAAALEKEAESQAKELEKEESRGSAIPFETAERKSKDYRSVEAQVVDWGLTPQQYLRKARALAKKNGYSPQSLQFATDGVHKLEVRNPKGRIVRFGRLGYGDYILWTALEAQGKTQKGMARQKRHVFHQSHEKIRGNWKKNDYSPNNLALRILW